MESSRCLVGNVTFLGRSILKGKIFAIGVEKHAFFHKTGLTRGGLLSVRSEEAGKVVVYFYTDQVASNLWHSGVDHFMNVYTLSSTKAKQPVFRL